MRDDGSSETSSRTGSIWLQIVNVSFVAASYAESIGDKQALKQLFQLNRLKVETKQLANWPQRAWQRAPASSLARKRTCAGSSIVQQATPASSSSRIGNKEARLRHQSVAVSPQSATTLEPRCQACFGVQLAGAEPAAAAAAGVKVRATAVTGGGAGVKSWRAGRELPGDSGQPQQQPQQVVTTSSGARRQREPPGIFGPTLALAGGRWKPRQAGWAARAARTTRGACRRPAWAAWLGPGRANHRSDSSLQSIATTTTTTTISTATAPEARATSGSEGPSREDYFVSNTCAARPRLKVPCKRRDCLLVAGEAKQPLGGGWAARHGVGETVFLNRACRGASLAKSGPGSGPPASDQPPSSLTSPDTDHCRARLAADIEPLAAAQAANHDNEPDHRRRSAAPSQTREDAPAPRTEVAQFFPPKAGGKNALTPGESLAKTNTIRPEIGSRSESKMVQQQPRPMPTAREPRAANSSFGAGRQRPLAQANQNLVALPTQSSSSPRLSPMGPPPTHHRRPLLGENGILTERTRRLEGARSLHKPASTPLLVPPQAQAAPAGANKDRAEEANNLHPLEVLDQRRRVQISIYDPLPRAHMPIGDGCRRPGSSLVDINNNEAMEVDEEKLKRAGGGAARGLAEEDEEERLRELFPLELRRPILANTSPLPARLRVRREPPPPPPPVPRQPQISEITIELEDAANTSRSLRLNCEWPRGKLIDSIRCALSTLGPNRRRPRPSLEMEAERLLDVCLQAAARDAAGLRQINEVGTVAETAPDPTAMSSADQERWCGGAIEVDSDDATSKRRATGEIAGELAASGTASTVASELREPDNGQETNRERDGAAGGGSDGIDAQGVSVRRGGATFASVAAAAKLALGPHLEAPTAPRVVGAGAAHPRRSQRQQQSLRSSRQDRQDHRAGQKRRVLMASLESLNQSVASRTSAGRQSQQQQHHSNKLTGESDNKREVSSAGQPDSTMEPSGHQGAKCRPPAATPPTTPPSYARTVRAANCQGVPMQAPEATCTAEAGDEGASSHDEGDCSPARLSRPPSPPTKGRSPLASATHSAQQQQQRPRQAAKANDGVHYQRQPAGKLVSSTRHQFQHQQQRRPAASWRSDEADESSGNGAATGLTLAPGRCQAQPAGQAQAAQVRRAQAQAGAQVQEQQAAQTGMDASRPSGAADSDANAGPAVAVAGAEAEAVAVASDVAPIRCITNWQTSEGTSQPASLLSRQFQQQQSQQQQRRHQAEQQQQQQQSRLELQSESPKQVKSSSESDESSSVGGNSSSNNKSAKGGGHYNAAASGERPTTTTPMSTSASGAAAAAQAAPMGEGNRNNSSGCDSVSVRAQQPSTASASASAPTAAASFALVVAAQNIASGGHQTNIMNPSADRNNNNNNNSNSDDGANNCNMPDIEPEQGTKGAPAAGENTSEEPQTTSSTANASSQASKPAAVPSQPPANNRSILILREIEPHSEESAVRNIFNSENCPSKPVHCEYALHNSWYVTFKNDEDAKQALAYIRKYIVTWNGQPIMARYKPKPAAPSATNQPPPNLEPTMVMHHPHLATDDSGLPTIGVATGPGVTLVGGSPSLPVPISVAQSSTAIANATANGVSAHPPSNGLIPAVYHQPPVSNPSSTMMQSHLQHHMGAPPPPPPPTYAHHHHHHHPHSHQATTTTTANNTSSSSSHNGQHQQHPLVPHHNHHHHHHHQSHHPHPHHATATTSSHHPHPHHHQHQQSYGYSAVAYYGQHGPVLTPWHYSNAAYDFSEVFIYNGLTPFHHHQSDAATKSSNIKSTNANPLVNGINGVSGVVLLGGSGNTGEPGTATAYQPPHLHHHQQQQQHHHNHHHHQHHHSPHHHHPSHGPGGEGAATTTSVAYHHHPTSHRSHHTPTTYHR